MSARRGWGSHPNVWEPGKDAGVHVLCVGCMAQTQAHETSGFSEIQLWIKHGRALRCASCLQLLKSPKHKQYFGDWTGMTHTGREQQAAGKPSTHLSLWKWLGTYCEKWDKLTSFSSMEDVKKKKPHLYSKPVIQNSKSRFLWRD